MRVAPELFLKTCVVGGLNKVFEIGKNFRNEGVDLTHNPEFTSCELYWAYADYNDLMKLTEELLMKIVLEIKGSKSFEIVDKDGKKIQIDFTPPFKKISVIEELEKILKVEFPKEFESDEAVKFLDDLCVKHEIHCGKPRTAARLIDKMISELIEPYCQSPTFLIEHP